jgi:hypothetical protein
MMSGTPPFFRAESLAERPMEVKKISSSASLVRHLQRQHDERHDHGAHHRVGHVDAPEEGDGLTDEPTDKQGDHADKQGGEFIQREGLHVLHELSFFVSAMLCSMRG